MEPDIRGNACVILPAYNAANFLAATLSPLLRRVPAARVIVVDDGSADATSAAAEAAGVRCLRHDANQGKGSALMTGLLWAREQGWEWAVTMDADGQHAVDDLDAFLAAKPAPEAALVVGRRRIAGTGMPAHRRLSNLITTAMISRLAGRPVHDAQSGYRMYRLSALERAGFPRHGRFEWEAQALVLCSRRGFGIDAVDVATLYTGNGTHMRLAQDTLRFLRMYWRLAWTR